jgi:hypothetical protein
MEMNRCVECGLVHPPVAAGQCPVAKGKKLQDEVKNIDNEKVVKWMQAIEVKMVEKFKKIPKEKSELLCSEIYKLIEKF